MLSKDEGDSTHLLLASENLNINNQIYKQFAAIAAGNTMEWYDFAVFGAVIDFIATNFFPVPEADTSSILPFLQSLIVYGSAFIMRPIGGIFMGMIGDSSGPKRQLEISVLVMLIPTVILALLPSFSQIGYVATFFLVLIRLTQGLAVGGEVAGAYVYTIEMTKGENSGFWGASCKATGCIGNVLGLVTVAILKYMLSEEDMQNYGWRIAVLLGGVIGIIGIYLRAQLVQHDQQADLLATEEIIKMTKTTENDTCTMYREYIHEIFLIFIAVSLWGTGYYTCFVWLAYFMARADLIGGEGIHEAWSINLAMNILLFLCFPFMGFLGDYAGVKLKNKQKGIQLVMQIGSTLMVALAIPSFLMIQSRSLPLVVLGQFLFVLPMSMYGANLPSFMVDKFPSSLRCSFVGFAYNISNAVFAGTAPLVQTTLVLNGSSFWLPLPGVYLALVGLVTFLILTFYAPFCTRRRDFLKPKKIEEFVSKT